MSTWCDTYFTTNDSDIVNIVKSGIVDNFEYNAETGVGFFYVKNGLANLNLDKIAETAKTHKSSFLFESMGDYYFPHYQIWEYKDGEETTCESRDMKYNIGDSKED